MMNALEIIGAVVLVLFMIVILVLLVILASILVNKFKRRNSVMPNSIDGAQIVKRKSTKLAEKPHVRAMNLKKIQENSKISFADFNARLRQLQADNKFLLQKEFDSLNELSMDLNKGTVRLSPAIVSDENCAKNRFTDVLPSEKNRVHLQGRTAQTDYINASFIEGYKNAPKSFIATQGPIGLDEQQRGNSKRETIGDFWLMVYQQKVSKIVMLTRLQENYKRKCARYWPKSTSEPMKYDRINVWMRHEAEEAGLTIRTFEISQDGDDHLRTVTQWHSTHWDDFKASDPAGLVNLVQTVDNSHPLSSSPVLVHCSAGVGRTGTYIALHILTQHIHNDEHNQMVNVFDCVHRLRQQRVRMVQTLDQYNMLYEAVGIVVHHKLTPNAITSVDRISELNETLTMMSDSEASLHI